MNDTSKSTPQSLEILRRLTAAFQMVDVTLTGKLVQKFWALSGKVGEMPTISGFDNYKELCEFINDCRTEQNDDRENEYFMFIFRGSRLHIKKGREWKLLDGNTVVPIGDPLAVDTVDDSGSLLEQVGFDAVQLPEEEQAAEELPTRSLEPAVPFGPETVGTPPVEADPPTEDE